jgi:type II secretory pathway predicted ATPase ExeA
LIAARLDKLPNVSTALYKHISRTNVPVCAPGSRDDLLAQIHNWVADTDPARPQIFWLAGIGGTGKSTVAQTVCIRESELKNLGATFFFSKQEKRRSSADLVFCTIAYQLLTNSDCPSVIQARIKELVDENPGTGTQLLEIQFQNLILKPLIHLLLNTPVMLVLDALDECAEQGVKDILTLFKKHLKDIPPFLKVFVTSRPEGHIANLLRSMKINNEQRVQIFELDPATDEEAVRAYLKHAFSASEIERVCPDFMGWELDERKEEALLKKTGGMMVVAATIVDHILRGEDDPESQLETLLAADDSNYTHLALHRIYEQVLEQKWMNNPSPTFAEKYRRVIGSIVLLCEPLSVGSFGRLIGVPNDTFVTGVLRQLHSLVAVTESDKLLRPRHPSFISYVTSPEHCPRSYHINPGEQHAALTFQCFSLMTELFAKPTVIAKDPVPPYMTYALCYWDDHLQNSSPREWPGFLRALHIHVTSNFAKWLMALFFADRSHHALSSTQQAYTWLVCLLS